ncbi:MAG: GWxTD domain-containing protein [Rhodothermales bacterium]|nr:GWxTD domain-containing protein [Rhodothermales bacterium]
MRCTGLRRGGLLLGLMLALVPLALHAQGGMPAFEVDAVSLREGDAANQSRLELYTRIPYTNLTFLNTTDGFTASYEVEAEVHRLDDRGRPEALVETSIWENTVSVGAYALTTSGQTFDHTTHALALPPGRYLIEFQLTDRHAEERTYVQNVPVEVRGFSGPVALSDLIVLEDFDEETRTIYPRVSRFVGSEDVLLEVFYEIYADRPQRVRVVREVVPLRKRSSGLIRTGRTLLGLANEEPDDVPVVFSDVQALALQRGRHQTVAELPLADFINVGDYLLRVRVEDEQGRRLDEAARTFSAEWSGLTAHISDLDEAIKQLEYVAKRHELREIKDATNRNERLRRFQAFWDKRDPTPGTPRNEQMEEYYYRIAYANRRFGSVIPGWKTDRGHVLVRFGEPEHVDRHQYGFGLDADPYEVWYYYRIGRYFIFIDKTGFGDYELLRPIWDEGNRIR